MAKTLKVLFPFGKDRSEIEKLSKKAEKSVEKVLTFLWDGDNLYKLTREAARSRGKALNLENDTEQEKRKQETVIPNELSLVGRNRLRIKD